MENSLVKNTMVEMNYTEIEKLGKQDVPVLFPLGVIEEHGPHLPLGTDIYLSYMICRKVKDECKKLGQDCLIAPPYYWGINHCTGSFAGTFSVRPETMKMILHDIFGNLARFGFKKILCINQHGDPIHNRTILEAIQEANKEYEMNSKLMMEPYDLQNFGLSGNEDFILLDEAKYAPELFPDEDKLDIHAGAYETASMSYYYKELVQETIADQLQDYSLSYETLETWLKGGEGVKTVVPFGYAGDPANYKDKVENMVKVFDILCSYIAKKINPDT